MSLVPIIQFILLTLFLGLFSGCNPISGTELGSQFFPGVEFSQQSSQVEISSSSVITGQSLEVLVRLKDGSGQSFSSTSSTVSLSISGGTSDGNFSPVEDLGSGIYRSVFTAVQGGSPVKLRAQVNGKFLEQTPTFRVFDASASLNLSTVSASSSSLSSGSSLTLTLVTRDEDGNQFSHGGFPVSFSFSGGGSSGNFGTLVDNDDGTYQITLTGVLAGTASTVSVSIAGNALTSTLPQITVTPGPPASIAIASGNNQSALVSTALGSPLVAVVKDASSNPVSNVSVNWSISTGGSLATATSTSDASGEVSNSLTVRPTSGTDTAVATVASTAFSASFTATATATAASVPTLSASSADGSVSLSWTASTGTSPITYTLYRSLSSSSGFTSIATPAGTSYSDSSLSNGTTYYYTVSATNPAGTTLMSAVVAARPAVTPGAPILISALGANAKVDLTWSAPTTGTTPFTYSVHRATSAGGSYTEIASGVSALSYSDSSALTNGSTYYYVVRASNSAATGAASNEFFATPDFVAALDFNFMNASSFQPHNLLKYSQNYTDATWTKNFIATTPNAIIAPDGTLTGTKLTELEDASIAQHSLTQSTSFIINETYTLSFFAKAAENRYIQVFLTSNAFGGSGGYANFDLQSGLVTLTGTGSIASIHKYPNGWFRLVLTARATVTSTGPAAPILISRADAPKTQKYSGTNGKGLYVWGIQLENHSGVSKYVATSSSPAASFTSPFTSGSTGLSFERSDSALRATVFGSDGLIRRAPHNLLTYSTDLSNAAYIKLTSSDSVISAAGVAPDGTSTAFKLSESTSSGYHGLVARTSKVTLARPYTFSVFLKAAERTKAELTIRKSDYSYGASAVFDLSTGTADFINATTMTSPKASIHAVGNGWYRCTLSALTSTENEILVTFLTYNGSGAVSYAGTAGSGILAWGPQLEQNANASVYLPTGSAQRFNGPRFEYHPLTLKPQGYLVEESRTNGFSYSDDMTNPLVTKNAATLSIASETSPDGRTPAFKISTDTSTGQHHFSHRRTGSNETVTFSIYAKKAERHRVALQLSNFSSYATQALFDLTAGTITTLPNSNADYSNVNATIKAIGNDWYRLTLTATKAAENTDNNPVFMVLNDAGNLNHTGDGTGVYFWGPQLETGLFPSSYIPQPGSSSVTRSPDLLSLSNGSWFNNGSTWLMDWVQPDVVNSSSMYAIFSSQSVSGLYYRFRTGNVNNGSLQLFDGSSTVLASASYNPLVPGTDYRTAFTIGNSSMALTLNGNYYSTSASPPESPATFYFGSIKNVANYFNGCIRQIRYYGAEMPSADSIRLTQ